MNIVKVAGLGPAYRLYQSGSDYVRVKIEVLDASIGAYSMTAEVTDSDGTATGYTTDARSITIASDQADVLPLTDEANTGVTGTKGDLIRVSGKLFEHDGSEWIERGTLDANASAAVAEAIATWDKLAREMAVCAIRAGQRTAVAADLETLIGGGS